jgi:hypothetical protein
MPDTAPTARLDEQLRHALASRHPILYLHSADEARVLEALERVATERGVPLHSWACTDDRDGADPVRAVLDAARHAEPGFLVLKDIASDLGQPRLQRALRDAYYRLRDIPDFRLVLLSGELVVPTTLRGNLQVVDIPPPDPAELQALTDLVRADYADLALDDAQSETLVQSLRGLAIDEARHVLHAVFAGGALAQSDVAAEVQAAKRTLAAGGDFLEYVVPDRGLDGVGGLSNLKEWITTRAGLFNQRTADAGEPVPRGLLVMGVSGCGKSLVAKVLASEWQAPLFRLDMNRVFSGAFGNPEATFHHALRTIESLAPVVLWIDEIENGLGFSGPGKEQATHLFSAFLTWMQEKPPLVFVTATANRIDDLPAEMIRKGRFDQVFFVDLPDATEREALLSIHLARQAADPEAFDLAALVRDTDGWNAAEVEQAVIAARTVGLHEQRPFTSADLRAVARRVVPLSRTMSEQIKTLRDWAWDRATPASSGKGTDAVSLSDEEFT